MPVNVEIHAFSILFVPIFPMTNITKRETERWPQSEAGGDYKKHLFFCLA